MRLKLPQIFNKATANMSKINSKNKLTKNSIGTNNYKSKNLTKISKYFKNLL